ncbi:hypothetical protein MUP01_05505 [Candidatus Bathyarchaeota archaeon]|nr:hypothetical protein [Candidatus Bathyarchaeota archaeon]
MSQLSPTITFIMPLQDKQEFMIEQINAIFKFSERYAGFCEILMLTDEIENTRLKVASLALRLNKASHPHVRTRIIRYTTPLGLTSLIETSINHAFGQKIVITGNMPEMAEMNKINDVLKRDILVAQNVFDVNALEKSLA